MLADDLRTAAFRGGAADPELLARGAGGSPPERWLAAVVLGAGGRYAAAAALLEPLSATADPVLASLACSTRGSHLRQLGGHAAARRWDADALRVLAVVHHTPGPETPAPDPDGVDAAGAASDALLGLAADALAVGRLAEARGLVARAEAGFAGPAPVRREPLASWRARVRHGWVCAELALAAGDPAAARAPAQAAAELAREQRATRHRVKSEIVLAVVLQTLSGTQSDEAQRLLSSALATAKARQWHSLTWPAAFAAAQVDQDLREYADAVLHGVLQRTDPVGREIAYRSPWVPRVADDPAPRMDADIWGKNFEKKATGSCQGSAESGR